MKVIILEKLGSWRSVANSCNLTVNKKDGKKEPSYKWKKRILKAEHSPIRQMFVKFRFEDIKSWISVHFVRHKIGVEHFVKTQRTDLTNINRDVLPQSNLVDHEMICNFQSIINISRKRLCKKTHIETRSAWFYFLLKLKNIELELYSVCVPECVYRGDCYEMKSCGFNKTKSYQLMLIEYREK